MMKDFRFRQSILRAISLKLTVFGLGALLVLLLMSHFFHRPVTAADSMPGLTTIDAPGAGSTANSLQGTVVMSIDAGGDVAGFLTDSSGVHHGFVRVAAGTFTEFDVTGAGTGKNQGTLALNIESGGTVTGVYIDSMNVYHGYVRRSGGTTGTFDVSGAGTGRN
jgi:hypothetical protein